MGAGRASARPVPFLLPGGKFAPAQGPEALRLRARRGADAEPRVWLRPPARGYAMLVAGPSLRDDLAFVGTPGWDEVLASGRARRAVTATAPPHRMAATTTSRNSRSVRSSTARSATISANLPRTARRVFSTSSAIMRWRASRSARRSRSVFLGMSIGPSMVCPPSPLSAARRRPAIPGLRGHHEFEGSPVRHHDQPAGVPPAKGQGPLQGSRAPSGTWRRSEKSLRKKALTAVAVL